MTIKRTHKVFQKEFLSKNKSLKILDLGCTHVNYWKEANHFADIVDYSKEFQEKNLNFTLIYPNQKLILSNSYKKNAYIQEIKAIKWHHPLGDRSQAAVKNNSWLVYRKPKGTPIHSINTGKVVVSGPDIPGYGNLVMISHPDGYLSLYAHCEKIFVQKGPTQTHPTPQHPP